MILKQKKKFFFSLKKIFFDLENFRNSWNFKKNEKFATKSPIRIAISKRFSGILPIFHFRDTKRRLSARKVLQLVNDVHWNGKKWKNHRNRPRDGGDRAKLVKNCQNGKNLKNSNPILKSPNLTDFRPFFGCFFAISAASGPIWMIFSPFPTSMSILDNLQHFPTTGKWQIYVISIGVTFTPKNCLFRRFFGHFWAPFLANFIKVEDGWWGSKNPNNFEIANSLPTMFQSNLLIGLGAQNHVLGSNLFVSDFLSQKKTL